jgi:beta-N-acetylhexosaminidase
MRQPAGGVAPVALVAFHGFAINDEIANLLQQPQVAGVTLFRGLNIETAAQTRALTDELQEATGGRLLIAIDQEGGQLLGAGAETTAFAGNLALGAVGDVDLTRRVGEAIGLELRALGINLNYAPVADVASRPYNPSLGIRSFGEEPGEVARMTAAMVSGLQQAGVAATLKHFPGKGEATVDPHYELPVLDLDLERLERVEFAPFRAGIEAGARLVMVGHYGLPAVTGDRALPATASPEVLQGLIRGSLGFAGVIVTDALDMGAFGGLAPETPLRAGADLLLFGPAQAGASVTAMGDPSGRVDDLLEWLDQFPQPKLTVVGCNAHRLLADELAARSITHVRDLNGLLPLDSGGRVLVVMPRPIDLTPADTSSYVEPGLAAAIRDHHPAVTEIVVAAHPTPGEIESVVEQADLHNVLIVGTIDANREQADLMQSCIATGKPLVGVALRTPYDLAQFPELPTYVCTYGIHPPSLRAVAAALFGKAGFPGHLPVSIPGLYPVGHSGLAG